MKSLSSVPTVLTIAGSDSGGGAGIQADLKTFTSLEVYGTSVLTSITAQNTQGVSAVQDLPSAIVRSQLECVLKDIGTDAAKTGMLSSSSIIETVADTLKLYPIAKLVVDPVMRAKSGDALLKMDAQDALIARILPLALIVTPNIPEAEVLARCRIFSEEDMKTAARRIASLGPQFILLKGGHLPGALCRDLFYDRSSFEWLEALRIKTKNTHGTGCTLSAAIAAYLARGYELFESVRLAKEYVTGAIAHSFPIGSGHGPLNHFWRNYVSAQK